MSKVLKIKKNLNKDIPLPELYVKNLFHTYVDDIFWEVNYCRADLTRHLMLLSLCSRSTRSSNDLRTHRN